MTTPCDFLFIDLLFVSLNLNDLVCTNQKERQLLLQLDYPFRRYNIQGRQGKHFTSIKLSYFFNVTKKGDSDSLIFCVKLKLIQMQYVMESYSRFVNSLAKSV